jgi:hypothetical protein
MLVLPPIDFPTEHALIREELLLFLSPSSNRWSQESAGLFLSDGSLHLPRSISSH